MASLVKQLDALVAANEDKKLAAVVNFIDLEEATVTAFADKHQFANVALTIVDSKNAGNFDINAEADLTAMHYRGKQVLSNHAVGSGQLNEKAIQGILAGADAILQEEPEDEKSDKKKDGNKKSDKKKSDKKKSDKKSKDKDKKAA